MASSISHGFLALFFFLCLVVTSALGTRQLHTTTKYHMGTDTVLSGNISINLIWYGNFKPSQIDVITDFITSLSVSNYSEHHRDHDQTLRSVATWWSSIIVKFYPLPPNSLSISLGMQVLDKAYSLGKSLNTNHLVQLAKACSQQVKAINVILTASDVDVEGFCKTHCGSHGWFEGEGKGKGKVKSTYIWVGNSEAQCPGQCGWPCHDLKVAPPNSEMGLDGMVINLSGLLTKTITNPFGNDHFRGPKKGRLEFAPMCPNNLTVDPTTGNAYGINGRKFSLPLDSLDDYAPYPNPPGAGSDYSTCIPVPEGTPPSCSPSLSK